MTVIAKRHPYVPHRRVALSEQRWDVQHQRGLYTVDRGEPYALPIDHISRPTTFLNRELWRHDAEHGTYRPGARFAPPRTHFQKKALAWLRDHVNENIPYWYYLAILGHDLHVSMWGDLYAVHQHMNWADPFTGEMSAPLDPAFTTLQLTHPDWPVPYGLRGFVENCGWLSGGKVTDAFVSEEIDELVSTTGTEYADFDFHEVGTSTQAESNNDTALIATTSIARATGTPTDADPIYQNVGSITADATETWEEHGLFNNSTGAALMDRSLTGGQSVNSSDIVQYTYSLTKNPEA